MRARAAGPETELRLDLEGMTCASCAARVEKALNKLEGVDATVGPAADMMAMKVPSAITVGVGEPISDYHYGNDLALKPSARVTVKVTVKGQTAVFHTTVPK